VKNPEIERVAETHYYIRPTLKIALKQHVLAEDGQQIFPNCSTYWDVFTHRFSDRSFDMGTLIRAAASVETGLRGYYMLKKGYTNLTQLRQDPGYKKISFRESCRGIILMGQWNFCGLIDILSLISTQ
jgi:hypothetical protein